MQLGQDSQALVRALTSGDRDLAFSVLLHLRNELPSSEFYFIVRKFPLGKVIKGLENMRNGCHDNT